MEIKTVSCNSLWRIKIHTLSEAVGLGSSQNHNVF